MIATQEQNATQDREDERRIEKVQGAENLATEANGEILTLTFVVTVTSTVSEIQMHLGSRLARELHEGGPIYLNDLVPEFEYESGTIEKMQVAALADNQGGK